MSEIPPRAAEAADELLEQLTWHWQFQARPRLAGLSDDEYFWEPAPRSWSVRPRGTGIADEVGSGELIIDYRYPEPKPPPVTTIAWRLAHILVGVLGERNARYFAGPAVSYDEYDYPPTAAEALRRLDTAYACWVAGVAALGPGGLADRCREHGFEQGSMAALVLHINREMIHHLAEIALLRDLYRHTVGASQPA